MESWTFIGFFVSSGVTLALAILALGLDMLKKKGDV